MAVRTVLSNECFDLLFHDDSKIVHHIQKPAINGEQLRVLLSAGTDLLTQNKGTKWLSDDRGASVAFSEEDTNWINNVWLPATVQVGWKYWALVVPESVMSQVDYIKYVESFYDSGIWVTVYSDVESALRWLENVDKR